MARDHALADGLLPGRGVLRFYGWSRPTVSLGRNEPAAPYVEALRVAPEVGVVRRPTGGRAVLHDRELTYALVVPRSAVPGGARALYQRVNQALVGALSALGVEAEVAGAGQPPLGPSAGPCFQAPAPGEVVVRGLKLVGSAQARIGGSILQHGSLPLSAPATTSPVPTGLRGAIALDDVLSSLPTRDRLEQVVVRAFQDRLGGEWQVADLRGGEPDPRRVQELRASYRDDVWIRRL